ncbi:MAG TPA: GlsB/YeaQ/YmgE family stress response membrane protein [Candidatus Binataceae bacterium]|nr:GlsB/YeaQ/YmgE family stress response membrane protein [Candidatus Binataceae bacterium]
MGTFSWIIVGLLAGFLGNKIINKSGEGVLRDTLLGILGALVGGFIFQKLGYAGVSGINLYSILVAVVGAVIVLVVYHAIKGQGHN